MMQQSSILGRRRALIPLAFVLPFMLGASLYLSLIFVFFCAIPIIYASLRLGRTLGVLCALANLGLVWAVSGKDNAAFFFILGPVLGLTMAESLRLRLRIEWSVVYPVLMMTLITFVLAFGYSQKEHLTPSEKLDKVVSSLVDKAATDIEAYKASGKVVNQDVDRFLVDPQLTKKNIVAQVPSLIGIFFLLLAVSNLLLVLKVNVLKVRDKLGLAPDFFKNWKVPEKVVWPTIAAGFCLVIEVPWISSFALNVFQILMAIYALQGLAILSFLFDAWDIRGFLRPAGYVIAVVVLQPLVISLGFFDLWFGFREKLRR